MVRACAVRDNGWRLPDALWARMKPLLAARPKHPLGCHNPRVSDRTPTDYGKLRTKRSLLTDGRGVPLGLAARRR